MGRKRWGSILLTVMLCTAFVPGVYALDDTAARSVKPDAAGTYTLSVEDAVYLAQRDNPQLQALDIKLKSTQVSLDAAKLERRRSKNAVIMMPDGIAVAYVKDSYYVDMYESQLRLGKLEREQKEHTIAYNVTEKYYNYKLMERLVNTTKQSYELALQNKNTADERLKLGMVSSLEAENAQVAVEQAKLSQENYVRNLDIAKEDLKLALQLDGQDVSFVLTDDIDYEAFESDVDKDIEPALQSRYDTTALREQAALAKRYYDITAAYSPANTAAYNSAYSDYIQADYNKTNNTKQIALSIRSGYNSILAAKGDLDIAEQNLSVKRREYESAKLKHDLGMVTNMQLTALLNELSQYEINVENAKLAYKLAVVKYQYNITIGI